MALATILDVPCFQTILATPMHAIYTTKHAWPTSCRILTQQPRYILLIWSSKIGRAKDKDHHLAKPMHRLHGSIFTDAKVLIGIVTRIPYAKTLIAADIF
jgi:hypothetical protein